MELGRAEDATKTFKTLNKRFPEGDFTRRAKIIRLRTKVKRQKLEGTGQK
jgi:outer membrane protein assembly factor BamD (BamD/ComL family)